MNQHKHPDGRRAQAKVWAALTLAVTVTTASAMAIANAQSNVQNVRPDRATKCTSAKPCITGKNAGSGTGVEGDATSGYGIIGSASGGNAGIGGYNTSNTPGASGIYGESFKGFGVYGYSPDSAGYGLFSSGNEYVTGLIYTGGFCNDGCSKTRHEASFAARTSQPTLDDIGEGVTHQGFAHVVLARDFANAIDAHKPYIVLVTPEGNAALYVSNRSASGFDVREVGAARNTVSFAYRIIAKPFGVNDERLPFKTLGEPAHRFPQ